MIHGLDVARAIFAIHHSWKKAEGQRWLLTDSFVYDWWSLVAGWGDGSLPTSSKASSLNGKEGNEAEESEGVQGTEISISRSEEFKNWVLELMNETDTRALPREMAALGRCYDTREFWTTFNIVPVRARI